eukprot:gene8327-6007_t
MHNRFNSHAREVERTPDSVFLGNLSFFCTHNQLRDLLSPFGTVKTIKICKTKQKEPLHYGFGRFLTVESAQAAINALNGKLFMGRKLRLCSGEAPTSSSPSALDEGVQVLVSFVSYQIHTNVTEEMLSQLFAPYGQVLDSVVKSHVSHFLGANQKQGGYGFVAFATKEAAQSVVDQGTINFTFGEVQIHCDCKLSKATATRLGMSMPSPRVAAPDADATKTSPRDADDSDDHVSVLTMSTVAEEGEASTSPSAATWNHSATKSPPLPAKATLSDTRPVSFSSGYSNESAATFGASPSMQSPLYSRASTSPMAQYPPQGPQGQYLPAHLLHGHPHAAHGHPHGLGHPHGHGHAQSQSPPMYVRVEYPPAQSAGPPPSTASYAPPSYAQPSHPQPSYPQPSLPYASPSYAQASYAPPAPFAVSMAQHQSPPPPPPFAYHQPPMPMQMPMQMASPGYGPGPVPMRAPVAPMGYAPQSQSPPSYLSPQPQPQSQPQPQQPFALHLLPHGYVPQLQQGPLDSPRGPFVHVLSAAPPLPFAFHR